MKKRCLLVVLPIAFSMSGCNLIKSLFGNTPIDSASTHIVDTGSNISSVTGGSELSVVISDSTTSVVIEEKSDVSDITTIKEGISYDSSKRLFTITAAGEYVFTGEFNGNILVNAGDDDDVQITLNGFSIESKTDSPIKCDNAGELQVSIKKGTTNYIYDYRETKTTDDDTQGNGAITASCDMKLSGKGSLVILAQYYNGIHCKDDLKIKPEVNNDSNVQIKAYNNCIKGNDSVTIESGNFVLISTNGNGIITENTDLSSKQKQRGTIEISGGQLDIYSAKDAIDAAYNADISASDVENPPIINIYTSNYSQYSNEVSATSDSKLYLRLSNTTYNSSSYYYAVEYLNADYTTKWVKASSVTSSGYNSRYTYLVTDKPSTATSFKVAIFNSSTKTMNESNAYLIMDSYKTISTYYDTAILNVSSSSISISSWTSYQTTQGGPGGGGPGGGGPGGGGPGGMSEGNDEKADVSAKGIKADNEINISAGKFFIKTYDDAIHANYGETFESGSTGLGDVNISGGSFDIYASDDGLHADHSLSISNGTIDINYSYEGVEGNIINISGGYLKVYSIDDGLNSANKSGATPAINISGGITDITVYGQDVDGIDSNGSFTQSGGYVITKGGNSQMSTGLDVDGTAKVNAGTFVSFGRTEKTPTKGSGVTSYTLSGSYSAGTYNVTFADSTSVSVTTKYSYSIIYVYSDVTTKITVNKA